jgi:hypothetical protein
MKKYLFSFFVLLNTINCFGQQESYPKYYIQNGDTLGVVYSIEQVQKIYNDEVLLSLFKDVRLGCDTVLKKYFVLINRYEQKQLIDKALFEQYEKSLKEKSLETNGYIKKISNLEVDIKKCEEQKGLKDGQIQNFQEIIDQMKVQRNWLLGGTIGFGALTLFLLGTFVGN